MIDPDSPSSIFVLVVLLILYGLFAATKESIVFMRASRRLQLIEEGNSAAKLVDRLARDVTLLIATEQLVLKPLGFFIAVWGSITYGPQVAWLVNLPETAALIITILVAALLIIVLGELIPREIARKRAEWVALWLIYPFSLLIYLAAPLARLVTKGGQLLFGQSEIESDLYGLGLITEDDLRTYMDASEEGGALGEDEKEMIYSIFSLDDTTTREIMVPRIDMVAIEAEASVPEALDLILEAGHSRLPVYVDSVDNIIGILYAKDLLAHWRKGGDVRPVHGLEREVHYVPETKPVSELLRDMQAKKIQIAVVVDEYGGTAGLVTIEDILEEIVGEIQDEYDSEEFFMEQITSDEYIFSARMDLDDINDIMSIDLPTEESDTIGGLIYTMLGRVPEMGDSVDIDELHLTVLTVDGRRIKTVKVQRVRPPQVDQEKAAVVVHRTTSRLINSPGNVVPGSS